MFEKEILERLQEMYRGGMTHDELSKALGISASYIGNILSGKQPVKNPTVDLLFKVFPRATVNLTGKVNAMTVYEFRHKAIEAVIDLDLPPDAMQAVLRALKDIK